MFKKYKATGRESVFNEYKFIRNRVTSELLKAKQSFFNQLHHADSKAFWKLYKTMTRKETNIPALHRPSLAGLAEDSLEKANLFNAQFFKNFNSSNVSTSTTRESINFQLDSTNIPDDLLCTEEETLKYFQALDVKKSSGADGISALMLKRTAPAIASSRKELFNLSISTGKFPSDWKFARVVPIPKAGARDNPANYRPISLLPIFSKILERHILTAMRIYLSEDSPLSAHQWGFMAKKSTTTALLSFTHDCQKYLDVGKDVCAVFFDLSKAFDSVPHRPLLNKISQLGIDPFLVRWIESYLSNRIQSMVLDGVESSPLPVVSGVAQGSILGPMLFLLYIDQAANSVSKSKIVMYADDIALYQSIQDQSDYVQIQEDVNSLNHWIAENHLKLNFSKCCYNNDLLTEKVAIRT